MKKILAVLVAIAFVFSMSPAAFAAKTYIPFWQNGGNVSTLVSIVTGDGTADGIDGGAFAATGATVTVTLYATDTSSSYTVNGTYSAQYGSVGTSGMEFARAGFQAKAGQNFLIDTAQIGSEWSTIIWHTNAVTPNAYSATATKFGYGIINTGSTPAIGGSHYRTWVAVYGGTNPAGFSIDVGTHD
ncbi:MAG: hypothetical protein A3F80_08890 [Candidatus Melainabacteria bacterium RIFCSPLOWO2_12_FULL_35_11]|nr:MAG: hypothetical protein A3F80_08890 [Candidatus Melainabacteria bacterium RIFCSPLOWO2_12_FULL_35_11]